ncbi:MAG: hypothetical protein ABEK50_13000, partial [bacterium]
MSLVLYGANGVMAAQSDDPEFEDIEDFETTDNQQSEIPPLEIRVLSVEGSPKVLDPEENEWRPLEEGELIPERSR